MEISPCQSHLRFNFFGDGDLLHLSIKDSISNEMEHIASVPSLTKDGALVAPSLLKRWEFFFLFFVFFSGINEDEVE